MNQNNRNVIISLAMALVFVLLAVFVFSREEEGVGEAELVAAYSETKQPSATPSLTPPANAWLLDPTATRTQTLSPYSTKTTQSVIQSLSDQPIAEFGKGMISSIMYSEDGEVIAITTFQALKWFDAHTWEELGSIDLDGGFNLDYISPIADLVVVSRVGGV